MLNEPRFRFSLASSSCPLCIKSISSLNKFYVRLSASFFSFHLASRSQCWPLSLARSRSLFPNSKKLSKSRAFLFTHEEKVLIETLLDSENIFNDLCRTKKWPIKIIILGDWQRRHHFNAKLYASAWVPSSPPALHNSLWNAACTLSSSVFLLFLF